MNPGGGVAWPTCLPQSCASRVTAAATAGSVARPLTTSTSRITGAGLKKCIPTSRPGWLSPAAMAVGDNDEGFVASTQSGATTFSRSANRACLTARSSATASITHRACARSPSSAATDSRSAAGSMRPLAAHEATRSRIAPAARAAAPSTASYTMTGWPATAATRARPPPMGPAPMTATGAPRPITASPSQRPPPSVPITAAPALRASGEVNVVVVERLAVDAVLGRGDPGRDLAPLVHRLHQRPHVGLVHLGRQPLALAALPFLGREHLARRRGLDPRGRADLAVEPDARKVQPLPHPALLQDAVPPLDAALAVRDVLSPQVAVESDQP